MANVHDVAAYINKQIPGVNWFRLQKLVYYSQVWSLVWDGETLFNEEIKAWRHGPVVRELHLKLHYGTGEEASGHLTDKQRATIDGVLDFYGKLTRDELIALSHREAPWRRARGNVPSAAYTDTEIPTTWLEEYYGTARDGEKKIPAEVRRGVVFLLDLPEDQIDALHSNHADPVDGDQVLHWLETGESEPWRES